MPLKSRTQDARAARTATNEAETETKLVEALPGDAAPPPENVGSGRGQRRAPKAATPTDPGAEEAPAKRRGRPPGTSTVKAVAPPTGDKKAAKARLKAIAEDVKAVNKARAESIKAINAEFDEKLRALKNEYNSLVAQSSAELFGV